MQAIERRDPGAPRVPLDLWVRLNHEDYEADFDADGVDLSMGGLALRSDYLPEVGDRLRCRFDDPREAAEIEVDGEVVWAHDAGERCGEFGLRFATLPGTAQDGLRALVEHLGGEPGPAVRLHLEGVASPIEGELVEDDDGWMSVEQELPFLELGMGVASDTGARGRLASVDLRLEGGVPRLVLGVELDAAPALETRDDAPPAGDTASEASGIAASARDELATYDDEQLEVANEDTLHDASLPGGLAAAVAEAPVDAGRAAQAARVFDLPAGETQDEPAHADAGLDAGLDAGTDEGLDDEIAQPVEEAPRVGLAAKVGPALASIKAAAGRGWSATRPRLASTWGAIVKLFVRLAAQAGPGVRSFGARLAALTSIVWGKVRKGRAKRRTTTAVPSKRVAQKAPRRRQRAAAEEAAPPRRRNRRVIGLSVLAFVAVGAAVYAFAGGDEPEAPEPTPTTAAAPPPVAAPEPAPAPFAEPAPAAVEESPVAEETAAPEAAPEPAGGPLAEPSYPTLRDANPSSGPVSEGLAFGADTVPEGRTATLRMSQPVTVLQGQAQEGGFAVTVPGALALDRAAPIASANPSVERAVILNRGDHAVLTVRFVTGRSPAYRVVARGRAIEVVIGR